MSATSLPPEIDARVRRDEPMAGHAAWRVGGSADLYFQPSSAADVSAFLRALPLSTPVLWTGLGTRLLVRDGGVRGAVITTVGAFEGIERLSENDVRCGAGVTCARLAEQCLAWGLGPAAFFEGLTGTLGGALASNAGAFGGETWRHVQEVTTIDRSGATHERKAREYEVGYLRVAGPPDEGFLGARLRFQQRPCEGGADLARWRARRAASGLEGESSRDGVFSDPPGYRAARLIESAGLAGHRIGGARVSGSHANAIDVDGTARAADLERLIDDLRATTLRVHGVTLQPAVRIVGEAERRQGRPVAASVACACTDAHVAPTSPPRDADRRHDRVAPRAPGRTTTEELLAELNITPVRPAPHAGVPARGQSAFLCSRQLGCPANLALATQLHNYLTHNGWALRDAESADCLIFVACVILVDYAHEVRAAVDLLARRFPNKKVFVTGCFVKEDLVDAPNVIAIPMLQKDDFDAWFVPDVPLRAVSSVSTDAADREVQALHDPRDLHLRPCNVLVATGCLRHCSYCIEPTLFPSVTSVPLAEIVAACKDGIRNGYKNFIIGAADVASYGHDLGCDVTHLFEALFTKAFNGHPDLGIGIKALEPSGFVRHFASLRTYFETCRIDWIYLPLESGSDRVLRTMNRRYRVDDVLAVVAQLREIAPALRIETDFVVAYPTETAAEFEASLRLLEVFDFNNLVAFGRHPNTRAFAMRDEFSADERARRCAVAATVAEHQYQLGRFYLPAGIDPGSPAGDVRTEGRRPPPMNDRPTHPAARSLFLVNREPGCPINLSLANRLHNYVEVNGWALRDAEEADDVVIVSCSSLPEMRQGLVAMVEDFAHRYPEKRVIVTCCFLREDSVDAPNVIYVPLSQTDTFDELLSPEIPLRDVASGATLEIDQEVLALREARDERSVFHRQYNVMVAVGCLNHCAFCSGKSMFPTVSSVPLEDVVAECRAGVDKGYTHLVLGASDIASYGRDLGCDVTDLFEAVFSRVLEGRPGIAIGLKGLEPSGFLRYFQRLKPYFASGRIAWIDMPIQSGSDAVLRSMNRRYRVADVLQVVRELRELVPGIRINTDVIFGYPTETREDFEASLTMFDVYDNVQMLMFQRHAETSAAALEDVFSAEEKARRQAVVDAMVKTRSQEFQGKWVAPAAAGEPRPEPPGVSAAAPAEATGFVRARFSDTTRADVTFDFTVSTRRLDARFCRTVGPYLVEAGVDAPAREAVPLLRVLGAALKRLGDHPPSAEALPHWRAMVTEILSRTEAGRQYRCALTFVPHPLP